MGKGEILPSAICQDIVVPSLELVRTADRVEDFLSRFETEVIGVVEAEPASCALELLGCEALERCLGRNRHENGKVDGAVGQGQNRSAGACGLGMHD